MHCNISRPLPHRRPPPCRTTDRTVMHPEVSGDLGQGVTAAVVGGSHGVFGIAHLACVVIERLGVGPSLGVENFFFLSSLFYLLKIQQGRFANLILISLSTRLPNRNSIFAIRVGTIHG